MSKRAALLLFLVLSLSFSALAQTRSLGAIRGRVTDPTGAVIIGADVKITNQATGYAVTLKTDERGEFSATGLPLTGLYKVEASSRGFAPTSIERQLVAGQTAFEEMRLDAFSAARIEFADPVIEQIPKRCAA